MVFSDDQRDYEYQQNDEELARQALITRGGDEKRGFKLGTLLLVLLGIVLLGIFVVIPAIDREMMKGPVIQAVNSIRRGNVEQLQGAFTPEAQFGVASLTIPAEIAIDAAAPFIEAGSGQGSLRFNGMQNVRQVGPGLMEAEVTVTYWLEGGNAVPYRRVPIRKQATVRIRRVKFLTWKIAYLTSDEPEFVYAISGALRLVK